MLAVFTDLDNCLLDHYTYSFAPALPALQRLRQSGATVIFTTSKTRAEVEHWHRQMDLTHPSIVENGGAVILPDATPVVLGRTRAEILPALDAAARESGATIRGFSAMPLDEIAGRCSMPLERARFAAARQYSEPFVLESPELEAPLQAAMLARGLRLTRGGRFHHALAHPGKHAGVELLLHRWRAAGTMITSIGIGDAPNDEGFLLLVDHPVRLTPADAGPSAWNRAIFHLLDSLPA